MIKKRGNWNWALTKMKQGYIVKSKQSIGVFKYKIDNNNQVLFQIPNEKEWTETLVFLSDFERKYELETEKKPNKYTIFFKENILSLFITFVSLLSVNWGERYINFCHNNIDNINVQSYLSLISGLRKCIKKTFLTYAIFYLIGVIGITLASYHFNFNIVYEFKWLMLGFYLFGATLLANGMQSSYIKKTLTISDKSVISNVFMILYTISVILILVSCGKLSSLVSKAVVALG